MDSLPPQLASGLPWQVHQPAQALQPCSVSGQGLHQDTPCSPGHLLMATDARGSYAPVKEECADETISALLSAPAFHSSLMRGVGDAALPAALEKPVLTIDTSPGLLDCNSRAQSSCPQSSCTAGDLSICSPTDAAADQAADECNDSPEACADAASKKRHRLRPEQTRRLMEVFEKTTKPDSDMRKVLGKELDMTPRTVQIWFQNRRAKLKRESIAAGTLKAQGRFPARSPDGRGRLTFNHAYLGRRQPARVASEGFELLRHPGGFASYMPDGLCGLPLQNPSQISVPMDMSLHLPGGHFSIAASHALGQSAMGVPVGQQHAMLGDARPSSRAPHAGGQALHTMFPIGTHGYPGLGESAHMYAGESLGISHGQPMHSQTSAPASALHLHDYRADPCDRSGRVRSFTTDSRTLSQLGQLVHGLDSNVPGGTDAPGFPLQGFAVAADHAPHHAHGHFDHNHHHHHHFPQHPTGAVQVAGQPHPAGDVPSTDALLETRRRHLQDLMIINQTHAARGMHGKAVAGAGADQPLLFSDLAQAPGLDGGLAAPTTTIIGSSNVAAQAHTALAGMPASSPYASSSSPPAALAALSSQHPSSEALQCTAAVSGQGCMVAAGDTSEPQAGAARDGTNSAGRCLGGAAMSQYQILHDILMQYNGMEFLDGSCNPSQPTKSIDQAIFMALEPPKSDAATGSALPTTLADIAASLGGIGGSMFGEEHAAAAAAAASLGIGNTAVIVSGQFGGDFGGCALSNADSLSIAAGDVSSCASVAAAPMFTVTSVTDERPPQSKPDVQSVVSVASDGPVGQREIMIEQLSFPAIQF
ncbi:hypothetical protein LPJ61_003356 [Coemansia biformis]|uniref:Homeobox domain-containing protein n=1 Tax=Coemansia biformis TaxID=1286918 RepID=A0A9W7YD08_9FUNG|nr:hypothetical protein LPJ61_003356 [Coemansia biformis]